MSDNTDKKAIPGRVDELAAEIRGAKILIVDDMALMRRMIGHCLEKGGFTNLYYAEDGQHALDLIDEDIPDLVVLDLNMPRVSGYDVCRMLRKQEATANLPILVQSASETPEERVQVFDSGATDFVSKPINQPELLARVCMHLENKFLIKNLSDFQASMRAELAMAREMQHSLLPEADNLAAIEAEAGLTFEAFYRASFELGGDLWGCWQMSDDEIGIYVLDISGHGVGAALNTFRVHATMARFEGLRHDPAAFLSSLNTAVQPAFPLGQFVTMFYGVLNYKTGKLTYSGAGAPWPLVISKDGEVSRLDSSGTPVGIIFSASYDNKTAQLKPGDSLFCYSDVLLEAPGKDGQFLGEDGLLDQVSRLADEGARTEMVDRILKEFYATLPGALPDDLTAVAIHWGAEA
ncbi:MAG: SpoIIE family protein phosphatase [Alphaproteobacteria bacterium]|nr:SpoIIE family protein phosphatase [Alphaproteobacteria bacterium]